MRLLLLILVVNSYLLSKDCDVYLDRSIRFENRAYNIAIKMEYSRLGTTGITYSNLAKLNYLKWKDCLLNDSLNINLRLKEK